MGTWSASITGSDTAQELMDEYRAAFSRFDVTTAIEKIDQYVRTMFDETDETEWCNYYYSLANFMWKKGILTDEIRDKAVEMVESDYGMQEWIDAGKAATKERRKELDKFIKRITSPQCEPKKIKVSFRPDDVFNDGEVIAIELLTNDKKFVHEYGSVELTDEEFLAFHKKYIVIQKAYSEIGCRSCVVPEFYDRTVCFRLFKGIYDHIEDIDVNALEIIPASDDYRYVFVLENSIAKFKKRNCKVIGTRELPEFNMHANKCYFNLDLNYPHYNFDSTILRVLLADRKPEVHEIPCESDYRNVRRVIIDKAYDEVRISFETKKNVGELIKSRIAEFEEMISNGARAFELVDGCVLGVAIKESGKPAKLHMVYDDDRHRRMLLDYVNNFDK